MMTTIQTRVYEAFGLRIESEWPLPELAIASNLAADADVHIRVAEAERRLRDNSMEYVDGKLYVQIQDAALYCIEEGNMITVSPTAQASEDKVRLYLLGSCMGALLLQRGVLPLHGSAVEWNGKAYIFVGDSGAGKSTLAASLVRHGCRLLTDDVAAITWNEQGQPQIAFAYPQQKMWKTSLDYLGLDAEQYRSVQPGEDKFAVPVDDTHRTVTDKVPLGGIYELCLDPHIEQPRLQQVDLLESIHLLLFHTYRRSLISRMGLQQWQFSTVSAMLQHTQLLRILRPMDQFTIPELTEKVLEDIRRRGISDSIAT